MQNKRKNAKVENNTNWGERSEIQEKRIREEKIVMVDRKRDRNKKKKLKRNKYKSGKKEEKTREGSKREAITKQKNKV